MLAINLQSEKIFLLPEKAIFWPAKKTLILSDLHWGKTAHFRKHGIAIPLQTQQGDEIRLAKLVRQYKAERLIIAGDLFHSRENNEVNNFAHWRNAHQQLAIELVMGNHDILPEEKYTCNNILLHNKVSDEGPFLVSHDVLEAAEKFYIHGHLHPSFTASGKGRGSVKLPCFCMNDQRMVLPSFGSFTGSHKISQIEYNHIYLVAEEDVIQWQ